MIAIGNRHRPHILVELEMAVALVAMAMEVVVVVVVVDKVWQLVAAQAVLLAVAMAEIDTRFENQILLQ